MISQFESLFTKQLNSVNQIGELQAKGKNTLVRYERAAFLANLIFAEEKRNSSTLSGKERRVKYLKKGSMAAVERGMRAAGKRGVSPLHGHHPSHHPDHPGHPSHNPGHNPGHLPCLRHPDHWLHHINSDLPNVQDIKPAVSSFSDSGNGQVHITLPFFLSSTEINSNF